MSFGDIFWPLFSALIAWSFCVELFNLGLRIWADRRERGMLKDFQERVERGEEFDYPMVASFDPAEFSRLLAGAKRENPTVSGSGDWGGSGQYL